MGPLFLCAARGVEKGRICDPLARGVAPVRNFIVRQLAGNKKTPIKGRMPSKLSYLAFYYEKVI